MHITTDRSCKMEKTKPCRVQKGRLRVQEFMRMRRQFKKLRHGSHILKSKAKFIKFIICNPCQSSPALPILVPLWFIIISLLFFFLTKRLFAGFF